MLLFSFCCTAFTPRLLGDAGTGWHIRNGERILATHSVPHTDPFSVKAGQAWYAWEWLYDALIAWIHGHTGLNGVVFFTSAVVALTFALALRCTVRAGGNLLVTAFLLLLAIGAAAIHLLARPHVLSWLMVVIWYQILDSWDLGGTPVRDRRLYWLPVLMLLWVNLHGGFVTGFMLLGLYFAALLTRYALSVERGRRQVTLRKLKRLVAISGLSFLASLLNPYSYMLYVHLYGYLSNRFLMDHIDEFRSPNFHGAAEQCFALLVLIAIVSLAVSREKPRAAYVLMLLFAVSGGMYASRNLPVSSLLIVMVIAPWLSRALAESSASQHLPGWLRRPITRGEAFAARVEHMETGLHAHLWPLAGALFGAWMCAHGGRIGSAQLMSAHFEARRFPVHALEQIAGRALHEPVFCPDNWGGYVIYRLYPQNRVFVDDRHDMYGEAYLTEYLEVTRLELGWQDVLNRWQVRLVLIPAKSALGSALRLTPEWRVVHEDETAVVFVRGMGQQNGL